MSVIVGTRLLAVVMLIGGFVWVVMHQRWVMFLRIVAAGALAAVLVTLVADLVDVASGAASVEVDIGGVVIDDATFPSALGIGVVAAVLTAAAPWLSRRWRRIGWVLLVGLMVTRFLATPVSFDSLEAALVGWLSGAGVLVLLGAPSRRPTAGFDHRRTWPMSVCPCGSWIAQVSMHVGRPRTSESRRMASACSSKRSATTNETPTCCSASIDESVLATSGTRSRSPAFDAPSSTRHSCRSRLAISACEHRGCVPSAPPIPTGSSLPTRRSKASRSTASPPTRSPTMCSAACWQLLGQLRRHRIAHRDLRLANIFLDQHGEVWLIDFGFSEMAAPDRLLATDVAELVASSSVPVGPERAVAHAAATVDPATLAQAVDRLHLWALSGATRTALKANPGRLDELREPVSGAAACHRDRQQ